MERMDDWMNECMDWLVDTTILNDDVDYGQKKTNNAKEYSNPLQVNVKFAFSGYATETKIPRLLWCNLKEKNVSNSNNSITPNK